MRAWLPERQVYGPERAGERDIDGLNRVFAEAFTDRYRRDGLVGVRVPQLNPDVWRYALLDAGDGAMLWRDETDQVAAFNIAHRSGLEGWMGPLAVRPDRQGSGVWKTRVGSAPWCCGTRPRSRKGGPRTRCASSSWPPATSGRSTPPSWPWRRRRPAPASAASVCAARRATPRRSAVSSPAATASAGPTCG